MPHFSLLDLYLTCFSIGSVPERALPYLTSIIVIIYEEQLQGSVLKASIWFIEHMKALKSTCKLHPMGKIQKFW